MDEWRVRDNVMSRPDRGDRAPYGKERGENEWARDKDSDRGTFNRDRDATNRRTDAPKMNQTRQQDKWVEYKM